MSDMQEENKEEAEAEKSKGSMGPSTRPCLEGEVKRSGWEVAMGEQDETHIHFRVYCMNEERDWYELGVKCPKKKFRKI